MSSKELTERMSRALERTGLVDPRSASFGDSRIAVLCRVPKENEARWIELITQVLVGANLSPKTAIPWQCHVCRHYFLKETNGQDKLVWGWNFSIHSREMGSAVDTVIRILSGEPVEKYPNELEEFPLPGSTSSRGAPNARGKGAFLPGDKEAFALWSKK